jgi:hypothetical protein
MYRFRVALLFLAVACTPSWGDDLRHADVARAAVAAAVRQGPGTEVRLADLTPFSWQRVYLFGPYTPLAILRDSLGLRTASDAAQLGRGIESRDDVTLLVFRFEHGPPASMVLPRDPADFGPELVGRSYQPGEAVFLVRRPPAGSWGALGPKP